MIIQTDLVCRNLAHPLPTSVPRENIAFLDLETNAFQRKNSRIQYLGLLFFREDGWYAHQWLLETPEDEPLILREALSLLKGFQCLVHYNGSSFDLPMLTKRCKANQIELDLSSLESLDLYRIFSPLKKLLRLEHLDQRSLERFLALSRSGNQNDLTMLPQLLPLLSYCDFLKGAFSIQDAVFKDGAEPSLTISALLENPVPNAFSLHFSGGYLSCENTQFRILFQGIRDTLKYFYPDYRNYYYLPDEDMAIHKSVASYVDKEHRRPAKAAECYTKKTGFFLLQKEPHFQPAFARNYKDDQWYLLCDEKLLHQFSLLKELIVYTVNHL